MSEQATSDAKVPKPRTYYDEPHEVVMASSSLARFICGLWHLMVRNSQAAG
jgi:hypothetical protein